MKAADPIPLAHISEDETRSQTLTDHLRGTAALAGQFASVIKDSSLLSMISVTELTQTMREISAVNLNLVECYLFLGVLYLILTLPVVLVSNLLEKRFRYEA